jgi:YidC/Oxa1 family membrane protein insertase
MMDKRTMLVVVACIVALLGWQLLIGKLYPSRPKPIPAEVTTADTNTNIAPALTTAPVPATNTMTAAPTAAPETEAPKPPEQWVVLSNQFVRVEFTSWGGGVRSVELLKYNVNGHGHVVLNATNAVPALAVVGLPGADTNTVFQVEQPSSSNLVFRARLRTGTEVVKDISLGPDYVLNGSVRVSSPSSPGLATQTVAIVIGEASPTTPQEQQAYYLGVDWFAVKYQNRALSTLWKNAGKGISSEPVQAPWAAVKSQFFAMILTPDRESVAIHYEPLRLPMPENWNSKAPLEGVRASLELRPTSMTNGVATYTFAWYAGPKEYDRLVALGKGQEDVMQFGFWGVISVWLLKSMKLLYHVIPNYGAVIVVITIIIKLIFWPIQAKSIRSMKEMQKFQPLMAKLKEKYKDDAQRMNQEMMKLYKEHKINPFSGCLPMLVQLPVLFAFYRMLSSSVELRGASFLWIRDLSQPDTVAHVLGYPINPLPLIMLVSSIWQMKLTPQTGDQQQQKMMMFMPVVMLFIFYKLASGLLLYYTVQQILSVFQQWWGLQHGDKSPPTARPLPAGKPR